MDYLADDALEGREAGSRGNREAGDYLAAKLRELGLRGAGVDGGFFQPFEPDYRNVLALLQGSDPEWKHQYVIVGAHYDHLGYGTKRNSRGPVGQIHNGADDNASGSAALLELAEAFTLLPEAPRRSILFVLWDAEEKGMLGSKHWISHPTLPLDEVVALVNLDMVGRLRNGRLVVFGTRTGYGWRRLVSRANEEAGLELGFPWDMKANGDHWPFFSHGIPVLMVHTGVHEEYHRPSDDADLINVEGMRRVTRLSFAITYDLADRDSLPTYRQRAHEEQDSPPRELLDKKPQNHERLGIQWERQPPPGRGFRLTGVIAGSPADTAGLQPGDRIIKFAGRTIQAGDELAWAVAAAESPVSILVQRPGHDQPLELASQLDGAPLRLGITWRADDAEPGAVVLTRVVAGSPAAHAGLKPGDYVYQVAGRDFVDEAEFHKRVTTVSNPLELLIERDGRLRTIAIHLESPPLRQAG